MTARRLTEAQRVVLTLASNRDCIWNRNRRVFDPLISMGLLEQSTQGNEVRITPAGRKALEES